MLKTIYNSSEVNKVKSDAFKNGVGATVKTILAINALDLLDKRNISRADVLDILASSSETFKSVDMGYLSINDIFETLKSEYNIDMEMIVKCLK